MASTDSEFDLLDNLDTGTDVDPQDRQPGLKLNHNLRGVVDMGR